MEESPWKEIVKEYFPEFIDFFFPQIGEEIDYKKGYEFLDKEFEKVVKDAKIGTRLADLLVKVYLKSGEEKWLLIHIEVQGYYEKDFAKRMYIYNYRIFDRYGIDVISLALLIDSIASFRPESYERKFKGFELIFRFPIVKLIDYKKEERYKALEKQIEMKGKNPISFVVMSYLKEIETGKDIDSKLFWKITLVKGLYEAGYTKKDILNLYRFIDWILRLPDGIKEKFHEEIIRYEEVKKMPYITTAEEIGIEKGLKEGIEKGLREGIEKGLKEGIKLALEIKFGGEGLMFYNRYVKDIDSIDELEELKEKIKKAKKVEELL